MTDAISSVAEPSPALDPGADPGETKLREAMELLFYAYRDFTAGPDAMLADYGFGRAHHRVLYFVGRNPGITVSELLAILRITKQSLARVLGQLVRRGFVTQTPGTRDRRQRRLALTDPGRALERRLAETQWVLIRRAWAAAGRDGAEGWRRVLRAMIDEADRPLVGKPRLGARS